MDESKWCRRVIQSDSLKNRRIIFCLKNTDIEVHPGSGRNFFVVKSKEQILSSDLHLADALQQAEQEETFRKRDMAKGFMSLMTEMLASHGYTVEDFHNATVIHFGNNKQ